MGSMALPAPSLGLQTQVGHIPGVLSYPLPPHGEVDLLVHTCNWAKRGNPLLREAVGALAMPLHLCSAHTALG